MMHDCEPGVVRILRLLVRLWAARVRRSYSVTIRSYDGLRSSQVEGTQDGRPSRFTLIGRDHQRATGLLLHRWSK